MEKHYNAIRASFSHRFGAVLAPLMTPLPGVVLPPFQCCFWSHWWRCRRCNSDAIMVSFPLQRRCFRRSKGCHLGIISAPFKRHFTLTKPHGVAGMMTVLAMPSASHDVVPFWVVGIAPLPMTLDDCSGAVDDVAADDLGSFGVTMNNNNKKKN